jgi:hypothetical protein
MQSREFDVEPKIKRNANQDNEKNTSRYPTFGLPERQHRTPRSDYHKPWIDEATGLLGA